MVFWTCWRALLNWPTLRLGGVFRLRGTTAISQQARAVEGLLGNMSSRSILEGGCRGKMLPWYIFGLPAMARLCLDAFPSARRWQNFATVRSRVSIRGNISPRCVPGRPSVTISSPHASQKWPRTGKSPVRGKIRAPCIRNELALAGYARHVSEMPCKSPFGNAPREDLATKGAFSLHRPLESCTTRESCHSWVFRLGVAGEVRGKAGRGVPAQRMRLAHCPRLCGVARLFCGFAARSSELLPAHAQDALVVAPAFA